VPPETPDSGFELKLVVEARLADLVASRLAALFAPDPRHPRNTVASLYFDDGALSSLAEARDGALAKRKVRLRWYESAPGRPLGGPATLEVKRRFGARRRKERFDTALAARPLAALAGALPARRALAGDELLRSLPADVAAVALEPSLLVRYDRRRFVDPASGSRLSLDCGIHAAAIRAGLPAGRLGRTASVAVLEVKNHDGRLPAPLAALLGPAVRRVSFSKYERCFRAAAGDR
jgi:hypothetical protein